MTERGDVTMTYTDHNGTERCGHDMVAAWCQDCAELEAAGMACGTRRG